MHPLHPISMTVSEKKPIEWKGSCFCFRTRTLKNQHDGQQEIQGFAESPIIDAAYAAVAIAFFFQYFMSCESI